jgi:hypothetical protein
MSSQQVKNTLSTNAAMQVLQQRWIRICVRSMAVLSSTLHAAASHVGCEQLLQTPPAATRALALHMHKQNH